MPLLVSLLNAIGFVVGNPYCFVGTPSQGMKSSCLLLFGTALLLLSSCKTIQSVDPELRRRAASLPILTPEEVGTNQYEIISEVLGVSCAVQAGSDPSVEGARSELRLRAAQLNADAVINAFCEEGGIDWGRNCWKKIECRADAIVWL